MTVNNTNENEELNNDAPDTSNEGSNLVKHLRNLAKEKDSKIKELENQLASKATEDTKVSTELADKVAKLEFDKYVESTLPNMKEKVEDIWKIKQSNPSLSNEQAIAILVGQEALNATPTPSRSFGSDININMGGSKDLLSMSDDELASVATDYISSQTRG